MLKKEIKKTIDRWKRYHQISEVGDISRRYFVMNAFDGALTMLGVIIGAYMAGILNPMPIISSGVAGSIAMGTSGFSGAYMTEKAERTKKLKELEKSMLTDMSNGLHFKSYRFAAIFAAIVDGVSPALAAMLVVSPFFLVQFGVLNTLSAFYSSITLTLISLMLLGLYLAKICDENMIKYGLQMLFVGVITAILCFITSILLGGGVSF
jgi:predicted membrane protein (TIGR00267 family)